MYTANLKLNPLLVQKLLNNHASCYFLSFIFKLDLVSTVMFYIFCFTLDDLISLLDSGIHSDHPSVIIDADAMFSEDMFGYSSLRSRSGSRGRTGKLCLTLFFKEILKLTASSAVL